MNNKYQNGKIYKIINDSIPGVYYGSTILTLEKRLICHKNESKRNKKKNCSSKELFEFGEPKIILIQNKPCNSKKELLMRERWYIENFECINKAIPTRTQKEKLEYKKKYYKDNKEKKKEYHKKYRDDNNEKRRELHKKYREDNKEKLKKIINCECGGSFQYRSKSRHLKTKKHLDFINN